MKLFFQPEICIYILIKKDVLWFPA